MGGKLKIWGKKTPRPILGAPQNHFGGAPTQFRIPQTQFWRPHTHFWDPQTHFRTPRPISGPPKPIYEDPRPNFVPPRCGWECQPGPGVEIQEIFWGFLGFLGFFWGVPMHWDDLIPIFEDPRPNSGSPSPNFRLFRSGWGCPGVSRDGDLGIFFFF